MKNTGGRHIFGYLYFSHPLVFCFHSLFLRFFLFWCNYNYNCLSNSCVLCSSYELSKNIPFVKSSLLFLCTFCPAQWAFRCGGFLHHNAQRSVLLHLRLHFICISYILIISFGNINLSYLIASTRWWFCKNGDHLYSLMCVYYLR
jgi:hypothetical protein